MTEQRRFIVDQDASNVRIDRLLALKYPDLSRTRLKALIETSQITVDGKVTTPSFRVKSGQEIAIIIPEAEDATPQPQEIPLEILYEDDQLIVLNKPAGMVVHPGAGNPDQTLVNALLAHCGESLAGIGGVKRPGIVHRLDKGTSGLMVAAKTDAAHKGLSSQFAQRTLKRTYLAIVWGVPAPLKNTIEGNIGRSPQNRKKMAIVSQGKPALTHYRVIKAFGTLASLVECTLSSGRTHQIRVHMTSIGHSLIGDPVYGRAPRGLSSKVSGPLKLLIQDFTRPLLHAVRLEFIHPTLEKKLEFTAAPPEDFLSAMKFLEGL